MRLIDPVGKIEAKKWLNSCVGRVSGGRFGFECVGGG